MVVSVVVVVVVVVVVEGGGGGGGGVVAVLLVSCSKAVVTRISIFPYGRTILHLLSLLLILPLAGNLDCNPAVFVRTILDERKDCGEERLRNDHRDKLQYAQSAEKVQMRYYFRVLQRVQTV